MFEALVITLREGVEGALVLAIALAFLRRRGLERLRAALFAGALAALVASVGLALVLARLTYNQELVEGIAMIVGAALVLSLVVWMWRAAPHIKREVESGITRATASGGGTLAVFLFAFGMVLREGVETALFLSAASFTSEGLALWLGAAAGLALAILFGVLFVRGSLRIPLQPFFSLTSTILLLIAIRLLIGGLHELSEAEVLPASQREMALIGPLVKNELLLFMLTIAVAAGWLLRPGATTATATEVRGPEARLLRAERQRDARRRRWTGVVSVAVTGLLATAFIRGSRTPEKAPATPLLLESGVARLEAAPLADQRLHFFEVTLGGGPARFFAVQVGDRVQLCFDACKICGDKGYYEDGSAVICRNCSSPIPRATLGRSGGCNPIPLPYQAVSGPRGAELEIRESDLRAVIPFLEGR